MTLSGEEKALAPVAALVTRVLGRLARAWAEGLGKHGESLSSESFRTACFELNSWSDGGDTGLR